MKVVGVLVAWLSVLFAFPALAQPLPLDTRAKPLIVLQEAQHAQGLMGHVTDPTGRLTQFERYELEKKISDLQVELHADLPVYLPDDLDGQTPDSVLENCFKNWKIGRGWDSGALLMITKDNEPFLYMGPGIPNPISGEQAEWALSEFRAALQQSGLEGAIDHTLELIAMKIREVDGTVPRPPGVPNGQYAVQFHSALAALLVLLISVTAWRVRRPRHGGALPDVAEQVESVLLAGVRRLTGSSWRAPAWLDVLLLTAAALALRAAWLTVPHGVHIFDEAYYVQDARVILGLPVKAHDLPQGALSFLDPNREHPPLAKLIMSLFMDLLGDNPWGQRSASVFFGTLCVPLVYMIVRRFGGKHGVGLLAAYFVAFDNLSFVHSRIATLDIFYVFFILCAVYAYAAGLIELSGAALALSTTCKITGLFGFATLLCFEAVRGGLDVWATRKAAAGPLKNLLVLSAWYVGGTLILLGALDANFTRFATPIAHIEHILEFGSRLTHEVPQGAESVPWQWLINEAQIPYAETREMRGDLYRITSQFRGAMNPYLIFFAPVGLTFAVARAWKLRDSLALLSVAMFIGTHAPYWFLWYHAHRICYLYYFLPTVPAIAMANALVVYELRPQLARSAYIAAMAFGMWTYFPFDDFPPHEPTGDATEDRPMQQVAERKGVERAAEAPAVAPVRAPEPAAAP